MKLSDGRFDIKRAWVLLFAAFFTVTVLLLVDSALSDISLAALVFTVLIFAVCILFAYKIKLPHFALLLGAIALSVRLVLVFTVPTAVESDFAVLLNASRSLIGGDMSYLSSDYFSLWAYQNGFVAFQSLLLLIWDNVLILKLANCIFASATVVLVYLIAKEFAGEKASRAAALIYCFLPFPLFYVTVLTNQFSASFLIYLGLYIFVSERFTMKRYLKCTVLGILLAFANVLRPESIIPLFAVILFILLTIRKSNAKESLLCIVILLAVYFVLGKLLSFLFVISGLSPRWACKQCSVLEVRSRLQSRNRRCLRRLRYRISLRSRCRLGACLEPHSRSDIGAAHAL